MVDKDMNEPLVSADQRYRGQGFTQSKQDLMNLFEDQNMKSKGNISSYKQMGGKVGLLKALQTSEEKGIYSGDVEERSKAYGHNVPPPIAIRGFCSLVIDQLDDKIMIVLVIAALFSFIIGVYKDGWEWGWVEGTAIWVSAIIISLAGAIVNYSKEKKLRKLMELRRDRPVPVIRDGEPRKIPVHELLVGDILILNTGEGVPVDAILISGSKVRVDEGKVTKNCELVRKAPIEKEKHGSPFILSGSILVQGKGMAVATCVGEHSRLGKIRTQLEEREPEGTPLQLKLEKIADIIGLFGMFATIITLTALIANLVMDVIGKGQDFWTILDLKMIFDYIIFAITLLVVAIPEGLPLAVTIAIAYSVLQMKEENCLVRKLESVECCAETDNVVTSKTGTLTDVDMTVEKIYIEDKEMEAKGTFGASIAKETLENLCIGICMNSSGILLKTDEGEKVSGSPTDCALLRMAQRQGYDYMQHRKPCFSIPFSSRRKRMVSVMPLEKDRKMVRVLLKGISEMVLERCTRSMGSRNEVKNMTTTIKDKLTDIKDKFAKEGLRPMCLAFKDIPASKFNEDKMESTDKASDWEELEGDMTFLALVGIKSEVKAEIKDNVIRIQKAGMFVTLCTGDSMETAKYVAKQTGIMKANEEEKRYTCMSGFELKQQVGGIRTVWQDGKQVDVVCKIDLFRMIAKELKVVARASPEDKYILVTGLRSIGNIVCVTAGGVADSQALLSANIGFSMGMEGTEVARESSDMVLLDDDMNTVISANKWGRNIYSSVRKFLQFQLTINITSVVIAFVGAVALGESPLTTVQLLWVNMIMDCLASMALATDNATDDLMDAPPIEKEEFIVCPSMWRNIILQSIWQTIVVGLLLFAGPGWFGWQTRSPTEDWDPENGEHLTYVFNCFVWMTIFIEISSRKVPSSQWNVFQGMFTNPFFMIIWFGQCVLQILIVEFGGFACRCTPITFMMHLFCIGVGFSAFVMGMFFKVIPEKCFNFGAGKKMDLSNASSTLRSYIRRPCALAKEQKDDEDLNKDEARKFQDASLSI